MANLSASSRSVFRLTFFHFQASWFALTTRVDAQRDVGTKDQGLAPPGQEGMYMGFAFLPIGIGSLVAGRFAGYLLHHFGEELHKPAMIWWGVTAVGLLTTLLLWIYDKALLPKDSAQ